MASQESPEPTVVQTELDPEEYGRPRRVAEQEGRSLQGALREAVTEYVRRHRHHGPADPRFDVEA